MVPTNSRRRTRRCQARMRRGNQLGKIRLLKVHEEFEFTSLRHVVSTAERFSCVAPEIREKGRIFATFATQSGLEKMTNERLRSRCRGFSPEPSFGSPVSRARSGEGAAITKRTQRESQLDFRLAMILRDPPDGRCLPLRTVFRHCLLPRSRFRGQLRYWQTKACKPARFFSISTR